VDKVWATLRTFGILIGLWVILAAVGLVTGVVPFAVFTGDFALPSGSNTDGDGAESDDADEPVEVLVDD